MPSIVASMMPTSNAADAIAVQRRQSLTAIVYGELERMILSGELRAGDKVNEQHLASQLGVSRGPIREARRLLERSGLVTAVNNQGVFVRVFDSTEVAENYDMRALVTGFICALAAGAATPGQIKQLRDCIKRMAKAITSGDTALYHEGNVRFHGMLAVIAGHARARQLYGDLAKESHMLRRIGSGLAQSNAEHTAIADAIAAGDAARSRTLGEAHVLAGKQRWLDRQSDPDKA